MDPVKKTFVVVSQNTSGTFPFRLAAHVADPSDAPSSQVVVLHPNYDCTLLGAAGLNLKALREGDEIEVTARVVSRLVQRREPV